MHYFFHKCCVICVSYLLTLVAVELLALRLFLRGTALTNVSQRKRILGQISIHVIFYYIGETFIVPKMTSNDRK
jgi:hypothetical protein